MLREYEITLISDAQLAEQDTQKLLGKYEEIILAEGGEIIKKETWGSKRLAFPIKGHFKGFYTFYDLTAKVENLKEAERLMRIDSGVLRYLSIRVGENVDIAVRKEELAKLEAMQSKANSEAAARRI